MNMQNQNSDIINAGNQQESVEAEFTDVLFQMIQRLKQLFRMSQNCQMSKCRCLKEIKMSIIEMSNIEPLFQKQHFVKNLLFSCLMVAQHVSEKYMYDKKENNKMLDDLGMKNKEIVKYDDCEHCQRFISEIILVKEQKSHKDAMNQWKLDICAKRMSLEDQKEFEEDLQLYEQKCLIFGEAYCISKDRRILEIKWDSEDLVIESRNSEDGNESRYNTSYISEIDV